MGGETPNDGDFVLVEYTGKALGAGTVFDTTDSDEAKKHNLFEEKIVYGPKLIVIGRGQIIKGLEDELKKMGKGDERTVRLPPEKAFGKRSRDLVRVMPLAGFMKGGITPVPGMVVSLDGRKARVRSVTSGRVMVDLNHPMAGEAIEYRMKLNEIIRDSRGKVEALMKATGIPGSVEAEGETIRVTCGEGDKEKIGSFLKSAIALIPGLDVKLAGEKKEKEEKKEEEKPAEKPGKKEEEKKEEEKEGKSL